MPRRGPKISPSIRVLIRLRALEEPRAPRDAVAMHLMEEIERMGLVAPTEDTLKKIISRERNRELNPLDEPWSLGVSKKYKDDFHPEIIPRLIELQKFMLRDDWEGPRVLTIRQAQWVAHLHDLVKEICLKKYPGEEYLWIVWFIADMYAKVEEMGEFSGGKFSDSSFLDRDFFITQTLWDMPVEEWATPYAAMVALYTGIKAEYRHDRTQKTETETTFQAVESNGVY